MKNIISFIFLAIFSLAIASCQTKTVDTKTVIKTTVKEIGTEGFLIKKVIKGDTIWGYSEETYGAGVNWREIVAENPFLNEPGRIYYDQDREKWIVLIYPGETVIIRGQAITPTFTSEETTVTTNTEIVGVPWWGWLLIAVGGIIFIFFLMGITGLISFQRCYRPQPVCYCPIPTSVTPYISYNAMANGDKRATVEGAKETTITHSANGELKITARQ